MCLAVPGKIIEIKEDKATVDFSGVKRSVDISLLANCVIGEYVLVHVGFAIQKLDEKIARETYRLLDEMDKVEL
jgi:hydrogenase expression/formation protein HypC